MSYIPHTEILRGYTIEIVHQEDGDSSNPRGDDNLGVMLCRHRRYDLGDSDVDSDIRQAIERFFDEGRGGLRAFARYLRFFHGTTVILPLYLYDHGGISISAGANVYDGVDADPMSRRSRFAGDGAGWDTSMVGFIFDTAATRELIGTPLELVVECLQGEVVEYDRYLSGDVYGFRILDADGEEVDSCWGFLSDYDGYVLEEARFAVPEVSAEEVQRQQRAVILARLQGRDPAVLVASLVETAPLPFLQTWVATQSQDVD